MSGSLTFLGFDKITLEEEIGRGSYSVFKARMTGKVMAAKRMYCNKNEIPHEVEIHNGLPPHPNIIRLLGVTHTSDGFTIFIYTELADKSLYQYLHTEKMEPSLEKSTKWAKQIAMGMEHLHRHGVAHRNLKPQNVLLFEREGILKLCDFGSSRVLEHSVTMVGTTDTYRWMAPEFNDRASTRINQRCDVYSYGMIVFEIFMRQIPFADIENDIDIVVLVRENKRPSIFPEVPAHIRDMIESCWEHIPHCRPTFDLILQMIANFPSLQREPKVNLSLPYIDWDDLDLEERIGRGTSIIYKGRMAQKVVAVKKIECEKNQIPHEVEIHSTLPSHPNIIPLLGATHSPDGFTIYVCMELANTSLFNYLHKEKKKPTIQRSTNWATQIARGMHHIHQHGLAHRDLKSSHILLFEEKDTVKLSDFGCAKILERTTTVTGETGTYRWMAPEFDDKAHTRANQRCDVFSYGMVLYEIFARKIPFHDIGDQYEVMSAVRDRKRPPIPDEAPPYIQRLIQSCWEHNSHARPTFGDILEACQQAVAEPCVSPLSSRRSGHQGSLSIATSSPPTPSPSQQMKGVSHASRLMDQLSIEGGQGRGRGRGRGMGRGRGRRVLYSGPKVYRDDSKEL